MKDERIHVIFYFISAIHMKETDVEFIKQLAPLANIIPIISKADAMNMATRNAHLLEVNEKLMELDAQQEGGCIFNFGADSVQDHVLEFEDAGSLPQASRVGNSDAAIALPVAEISRTSSLSNLSSSFTPNESVFVGIGKSLTSPADLDDRLLPIQLPNLFAVICDFRKEQDMNHSDFRRLQILLFERGTVSAFQSVCNNYIFSSSPFHQ